MHNRVDVGIRATAPFPGLVLRVLNAWQRRALGVYDRVEASRPRRLVVPAPVRAAIGCRHRAVVALRAAARSSTESCRPGSLPPLDAPPVAPHVDVIWNGIDDDVLDAALAAAAGRPRAWAAALRVDRPDEPREAPAALPRGGRGLGNRRRDRGDRRRRAAARRPPDHREAPAAGHPSSSRAGCRMPRRCVAIQAADAVVQTSIGFETQGMTVFEAASLGTPAVVSRPRHRRRAGFRPVGCGRWLGGCARGDAAACCRRHRGRHRARTRPDSARAVPPVVADGRDDRGLRARHRLIRSWVRGAFRPLGRRRWAPTDGWRPNPELSVAVDGSGAAGPIGRSRTVAVGAKGGDRRGDAGDGQGCKKNHQQHGSHATLAV